MFFLKGILNGVGEIWAHKLRSALTITCVMLGVASLVLISGFVSGLFRQAEAFERNFGWNQTIYVSQMTPPPRQTNFAGLSPGRTINDAVQIRKTATHLAAVAADIETQAVLDYHGLSANRGIEGVEPDWQITNRVIVDHGRFITDTDVTNANPVIVLGTATAAELFLGHDEPVGKTIAVNGQPFKVVGVLHNYVEMDNGRNILRWKNYDVYVPITAVQRRLTGSGKLTALRVRLDSEKNFGTVTDQVNSILLGTHRGILDFSVENREANVRQQRAMQQNYYIVGGGIGAITMLVGGIGIMNLMLASINERVREIGVRKAVGAWTRDIFVQFVAEAIALSTLGGVFGVLTGTLSIRLLQVYMAGSENAPPKLSPTAVLVGLGFSVVTGTVAGLYPAFKASRLDPIEALRYE